MEINEIQKQMIEKAAKKYALKLVLLFGSQATGRIHKESDYDVAFLSENDLDFEEKLQLNVDFTVIFRNERERVDTVDLKKPRP